MSGINWKRNERKRNERKRNERKRNERKRNERKRNERKRKKLCELNNKKKEKYKNFSIK
jgi:hypothetical protein